MNSGRARDSNGKFLREANLDKRHAYNFGLLQFDTYLTQSKKDHGLY